MKKDSSKKHKYGLPQDLSDDIGSTITITNDNIGTMNYRLVPVTSVETDPLNPRRLAITRDELLDPISSDDTQYEQKCIELEKLQLLAETVKKFGVRNPIEIYKDGSTYRLIHGERRLFSSIIAGKNVIPAKVHEEKPHENDISVLQLIENIQREDLSLRDLLAKLAELIGKYKENKPDIVIDANFLHNLTYKSKTQCFYYLTILNGPEDVLEAIFQGKIKSFKKAHIIASEKDTKRRGLLIEACVKGSTLDELTSRVEKLKKTELAMKNTMPSINTGKRRGKVATKIYLGETKNIAVIKKLIDLVLSEGVYSNFANDFQSIRLDSFGDCTEAFKALLRVMERVESEAK